MVRVGVRVGQRKTIGFLCVSSPREEMERNTSQEEHMGLYT